MTEDKKTKLISELIKLEKLTIRGVKDNLRRDEILEKLTRIEIVIDRLKK